MGKKHCRVHTSFQFNCSKCRRVNESADNSQNTGPPSFNLGEVPELFKEIHELIIKNEEERLDPAEIPPHVKNGMQAIAQLIFEGNKSVNQMWQDGADFLEVAHLALELNWWRCAELFAIGATKCDPASGFAWYALGTAVRLEGRWVEAERAFNEAVNRDATQPEFYFDLGLMQSMLGKYVEAETSLKQGLTLDPTSPNGWLLIARNYHEMEQLKNAEHAYQQAMKYTPSGSVYRKQLEQGVAELHDQKSNFIIKLVNAVRAAVKTPIGDPGSDRLVWDESAMQEILVKLAKFSSDVNPWVEVFERYFRRKAFPQAEIAARLAIHSDSANPLGWERLCGLFFAENRLKDARNAAESWIRQNPKDPQAYIFFGRSCLHVFNDPEAAEKAFQKAIEVGPDLPDAWVNFAIFLHFDGKAAEAQDALRKAKQMAAPHIGPEIDELFTGAVKKLETQVREQIEKANRIADAYPEFRPPNVERLIPTIRSSLGFELLQEGKASEAEMTFRKALTIDPNNVEALTGLGESLMSQRRLEAARDVFEKAVNLDPSKGRSWHGLAEVWRGLKNFAGALLAYEKALAIAPKNAYVLKGLGFTRGLAGDLEGAERDLRKAIDLDPTIKDAWNNLAWVYALKGDHIKAIEALKKAIAIDPNYAIAWANLGMHYRDIGDWDNAIAAFERELELQPGNPAAEQELAAMKFARERAKKSQRVEK